ncbi:MAG: methylated-DNA--[protein]-cysteine S-methyltransferase [Candidatus Thorarchaeota archaeon]
MTHLFYSSFRSPFNSYTIVWEGQDPKIKIKRIFLSNPKVNSEKKAFDSFEEIKLGSSHSITSLNDNIQNLLQGKDVKFELGLLDFSLCQKFQNEVLLAEFEVPKGYVSTYKRIATHIGKPNATRAVGNVLAHNPFPLIIPCHRVIKSNGELGEYQGGFVMKRTLLELEGIEFSDSGKVVTNKIFY